MVRVAALLRQAATPGPQTWAKHDLYDALFYVRVVLGIVMGIAYGAVGAQGVLAFLSFMGANLFIGGAFLRWQGIDEAEYEDPERVQQSPLAFEGFAPSVSFFVLSWITVFTLAH